MWVGEEGSQCSKRTGFAIRNRGEWRCFGRGGGLPWADQVAGSAPALSDRLAGRAISCGKRRAGKLEPNRDYNGML
jgi:hypothetical protein